MAARSWIPGTVLYVQGFLLIGIGTFALLDPDAFVAGTDDVIVGKPEQLLHSIRHVLARAAFGSLSATANVNQHDGFDFGVLLHFDCLPQADASTNPDR